MPTAGKKSITYSNYISNYMCELHTFSKLRTVYNCPGNKFCIVCIITKLKKNRKYNNVPWHVIRM